MSATPMTLEDALRFSGYTLDTYEHPGTTITTDVGSIVVPPMILSRLVWQRTHPPTLGSAFYLDKLPAFHEDYRPVMLSLILDRYRGRRLGRSTPDEFALAVRRWGTVHLGGMSTINRLYLSTATDLPLTDVDLTRVGVETSAGTDNAEIAGGATSRNVGVGTAQATTNGEATDTATTADTSTTSTKGRDAQSDYPQGQLAGNLDYASGSVDRVADSEIDGSGSSTGKRVSEENQTATDNRTDTRTDTNTETRTGDRTENRDTNHTERGRSSRSVMELLQLQRATFVNVDETMLDAMEPLFLGVFDRSENEYNTPGGGYRTGFGW